MQMVSGAKLNQVEQRSINYQIYANKIREIVTHLAAAQLLQLADNKNNDTPNESDVITINDLLQQRPVKKTGYLVITSDRGLVGSYNSTVIRAMTKMIADEHKTDDEYVFMAIGSKGADFFKSRGMNMAYEYRGVSDIPTFDEVRKIVKTVVQMYDNEVFDELYVCYNHHINTLTSEFRAEKMLPINDLDVSEIADSNIEYITDPSKDEVLDRILPQYAESLIYGAIIDAKAAEHAASMTAMKAATDNADNLVSDLTLQYNRARQAAITTEIAEIVGGANALNQSQS